MHCTLLVPDLFWPDDRAQEACRDLAPRNLQTLLSRARSERHLPIEIEGWLCQAFEVERQQDWPVAPLTLVLDGGDTDNAYWLRADPVHLQLQRDRVALMDPQTLQLSQQDADALAAALNTQFAADGLRFEARTPHRWYVRLPARPALTTVTLSAAAGHDARDVLPQGTDAASWRRVTNEIQMLMHAQPVNEARTDAGLPAINSIWLWGGGSHTPVPGRTFSAVWSDDALALALGASADAHTAAMPADAHAWLAAAGALPVECARHLLVVDACARAVRYGDIGGWRNAIMALEQQWIAPLMTALRNRQITRLALAAPCAAASWCFELSPAGLYKFWKPVRPLSYYGDYGAA